MGLLDKLFSSSAFKDNKYDIDRKEYKAFKAELKEKYGIKLTRQQKADFKEAIKSGRLSEYLDSSDMQMKSAMGLTLSNKIGKTDANKDVNEARRLASAAFTDADLLNTLKVTNPDIYNRVVAYNSTPLASSTQKGFEEQFDKIGQLNEFGEGERYMAEQMANSPFMQELDNLLG